MAGDSQSDNKIVDSWTKNASPWITAVRNQQIESRVLTTNNAIVNAVLSCSPGLAIDLGCGEGWLTRKLTEHGFQAIGIDVVPDLIDAARQTGQGDFRLLSYEQLASEELGVSADTLVCNFSLLGKESVEEVFKTVARLLKPGGVFIIQTIHPLMGCGENPYQDGWRVGSWDGFSDDFTDPAPWYFRTMESWVQLFQSNGLRLLELREPLHPKSGKPASVIFIAEWPGQG